VSTAGGAQLGAQAVKAVCGTTVQIEGALRLRG